LLLTLGLLGYQRLIAWIAGADAPKESFPQEDVLGVELGCAVGASLFHVLIYLLVG
jgi:hypothetical protein